MHAACHCRLQISPKKYVPYSFASVSGKRSDELNCIIFSISVDNCSFPHVAPEICQKNWWNIKNGWVLDINMSYFTHFIFGIFPKRFHTFTISTNRQQIIMALGPDLWHEFLLLMLITLSFVNIVNIINNCTWICERLSIHRATKLMKSHKLIGFLQ